MLKILTLPSVHFCLTMHWTYKSFDELSGQEVYEILAARAEVFVVEQNCVYLDVDGTDQRSLHIFCKDAGKIMAYARLILEPARSEVWIGRILVTKEFRGRNLGRELLRVCIAHASDLWPEYTLALNAQAHLRKFYESFGFTVHSPVFDEDGIPHVTMHRPPFIDTSSHSSH